ncbi:hypothetical protein LTR08_007536 [Meristemomyces frigidus]|nr:hypothetical protein LTR08_007536 [Meristemomyces frigidus]
MLIININLQAVIETCYLAQHYFRRSPPDSGPRNLIMTASAAGVYASPVAPMYSATKHGVVGWARSIAPSAWRQDHMFPDDLLTPVSKVVEVVLMLLDGKVTSEGDGGALFGQIVEVCGTNHYFRKQYDYCDGTMQALMTATDVHE